MSQALLGLPCIILLAWLTPVFCSLGAVAPSFWMLTATQTVARPLGIALAMLAGVAAFGVAVYWVTYVERDPSGAKPSLMEWRPRTSCMVPARACTSAMRSKR